jgi:hypothetical protein
MAVGDFNWANDALAENLGEVWEADNWGHQLLFLAYYDRDLSPDLRFSARDALDSYLDQYYDVDLDDIFDYEAYKEWYDSL